MSEAGEKVAGLVREMGEPRLIDVAVDIAADPILGVILHRDHVRIEAGENGEQYHFTQATWAIDFREVDGNSDKKLADLIRVRRLAAVASYCADIKAAFTAQAGEGADPKEWRTLIPKGRWLFEKLVSDTLNLTVQYAISGMCRFERKEEVNPDVVTGPVA